MSYDTKVKLTITILLIVAVIVITILAGCTDNRIHKKPTLDYKIDPEKRAEYELYVTRELWAQWQLKISEQEYRDYENEE